MKKRKAIRTGKRDLFKKIRGNPGYISCKRQAWKRTEMVWTLQKKKILRRGGKQSKWRLFTVPPPKPSIRRCELWLIHLDMMLLMGNTPTGSEWFNIPIPALTSPSVKRPHNHSILTLAKQRWQHYHIALLCGELHEIMNSPVHNM